MITFQLDAAHQAMVEQIAVFLGLESQDVVERAIERFAATTAVGNKAVLVSQIDDRIARLAKQQQGLQTLRDQLSPP